MEGVRVELLVISHALYSIVDLIVITERRSISLHFSSSEGILGIRLNKVKASKDSVSIGASAQEEEVEVSLHIVHEH